MTLQGDPSLCCSAVSLKLFWKTLEQQGEGLTVEYSGLQMVGGEVERPPTDLTPLLEEFAGVFEEP